MIDKGLRLEVIGTGAYLPDEVLKNDHFLNRPLRAHAKDGGLTEVVTYTDDSEIIRRTGILERRRERRGEKPSDLAYHAAVQAIERAGISVDSLTGIIMATVTEDCNYPNGAQKVQRQLGAKNCFAYDIANACAGFPEALAQANGRVIRRPGNYLVLAGECMWSMTEQDYIQGILFGSGGGAAILRPTEEPRGIIAEYSKSNPFEGRDGHIYRNAERMIRMPFGNAVMKEAITEMMAAAQALKEQCGWPCANVIIPHQANYRITKPIIDRVAADGTYVYNGISHHGNMSSATCAFGLDYCLREGVIKHSTPEQPGSKVIIVAFGAGESTSAVAMQF